MGIKNEEQFNALHGVYEFVENHLEEQERPEYFLDKINYLKWIYHTHGMSCATHHRADEKPKHPIKPTTLYAGTPSPPPKIPPCQSPPGASRSQVNATPPQDGPTLFTREKSSKRGTHHPQAQPAQPARPPQRALNFQ